MEIIQVTSKFPHDSTPLIVMIGSFDGIHLGHQAVLKAAKELKKEEDILAVMSFSFHPVGDLKEDTEHPKEITPEKEKTEILESFGVQRHYHVILAGDRAENPVRGLLEQLSGLNVKRIVVGEEQESSAKELAGFCAERNIPVTVVPIITENGRKISSSMIRSLITDGKMEAVLSLLGRPYTVTGEVVHGEALGRTLGFPTINLGGEADFFVYPKPGVYLGTVEIHNEGAGNEFWNVLISAGYRPTVNGKGYLIEAHLLDYSGDLYGKTASVSFLRYMREEINFTGLDPLIKQMELDKVEAKKILGIS